MKQQKSFSFFCCYCEEPRKKEKNNQRTKIFEESSQISKIYKIDTNSNYSEKIIPPSKIEEAKIEKEKEKEQEKVNLKEKKKKKNKYELEEINTINSYKTLNNKNKTENIKQKENINNQKNKHNNFLRNDINSFLAKKERNNINIENLSSVLKKYGTENNTNRNSIQNERKEIIEEHKNEDINNNFNKNINNNINEENNNNLNRNKVQLKNGENQTNYNIINNNPCFIKMDEKENTISQTIRKIHKFELEDKISQEQLLWKNKSNLNKSINSSIIKNNSNNKPKNNIIDISNNNISNKSINNEIKNEKDTNPINKIDITNIENDITYDKVKDELTFKKDEIKNDEKPNQTQKEKEKEQEQENKTMQIKGISKFSLVHNNENNSLNSAIELKANINNIKMNLIEDKKPEQVKKEENKNEIKEIKDINQTKEINNTNTQREILDQTNVLESQSQKETKSIANIEIKEGINVKLNYLKELCPSIKNQEEKKEEELTKSKKESVSEEIDDEVCSIDEFNNANDNRSVLSSYIFSSVRPTESNKSCTSSVYGRSETQEIISNYNEIMSNKGMRIFPMDYNNVNNNNKEVEIRIDNLYKNRKNYFISMQMNQIRKMKEKINEKEKTIQSNYDNIEKIKKKIDKIENEEKQYERWIEKEEEENEHLVYLLNFLTECT